MQDETDTAVGGKERRRYYRADDAIGLEIKLVSDTRRAEILANLEVERRKLVANAITVQREKHLPALQTIAMRYPEIAAYLAHLGRQVEMLAGLFATTDAALPLEPTHQVSLSGQGIFCHIDQELSPGSLLELRLTLFPERVPILLYGTVVRCRRGLEAGAERPFGIAVDFTHIHEEDREILLKHIHSLQIRSLREHKKVR